MTWRIEHGDCREVMAAMEPESVQCVVTSPPYWGLRDYGVAGQLGLEPTPESYVAALVEVFREVRRVLRKDGTLWLNLGDSYVSVPGAQRQGANGQMADRSVVRARAQVRDGKAASGMGAPQRPPSVNGLKPKDLVGIPWRVAFALQDDGWWLRSDIIWAKPNPMPESVRDRPTRSHEYLFLLTKAARYYYDADAIAEEQAESSGPRLECAHSGYEPPGQTAHRGWAAAPRPNRTGKALTWPRNDGNAWNENNGRGFIPTSLTRNARNVWTIATSPYPEAHFATFPPEIPRRCILAGTRPGDLVLDPFAGAGTTVLVADRLGRDSIGIELNPDYCEMARRRIEEDAPLFSRTVPGTANDAGR